MKFRKEYQTYLLIVIAIITTGYFLKPFFFNKKKKVIEGQAGTTTYYRIAFNSTDLSNLLNTLRTPPTPTEEDLLKELILTQYDTVVADTTGNQYVNPDAKYDALMMNLIPATLFMKDSNDAVLGLKVAACTGNKLDFFNKEAAAAADTAAATADTATAAVAAYDYARLILSNTYKDNLNIMALIAAANLLTIMGQPNITTYTETVVKTAKTAAKAVANTAAENYAIDAAYYADYAADYAAAAETSAKNNTNYGLLAVAQAFDAVEYAAMAAAYAMGDLSLNDTTVKQNVNYKKVMAKYNSNPANMKAAFITAAGLIYQSL